MDYNVTAIFRRYSYTDLVLYTLYVKFLAFFSKCGALINFKYANVLVLTAVRNSNIESLVFPKAIFCPKTLNRNIMTNNTVYLKRVNQRKSRISIVKKLRRKVTILISEKH